MAPRPELPLLYRDRALAVINKPAGLAVHRGAARDTVTALDLLRDQLGQRVDPAHRLDRPASGVLAFALTKEAASHLGAQFAQGGVAKRYLALVRGPAPEAGEIDHPLPRDEGGERVPARTRFRLLGTFERYSLLEVVPETGRRHQIRRHFKHLALPLIGDVLYGKGEHNRLFRERFGLHRLALHCLEIGFAHPDDGARLRVHAPVPEDLAGPLRAMGFLRWPRVLLRSTPG